MIKKIYRNSKSFIWILKIRSWLKKDKRFKFNELPGELKNKSLLWICSRVNLLEPIARDSHGVTTWKLNEQKINKIEKI